MQKFNGSLIRQFPSLTTGNAAAGVQVSVFASGTNTLATLYATNNVAGAQLSNPLTTDGKGFYSFFAVDGRYRLEFNNGFPALEVQLVDVIDINTEFNAAVSGLQDTIDTLTLTVAFDFNTGGTVTARNQVVLWSTADGGDGREYRWAGALPKTVPAASTPASTGGISDSAWVYTANIALEQELAAADSTTLVGGEQAGQIVQRLADAELQIDSMPHTRFQGLGNTQPGSVPTDKKPVMVLGDSVSHGAFAGELYYFGWTRILARMLNSETNSKNYGFAPLVALTGTNPMIHDVSFSGTWNSPADGNRGLSGRLYRSEVVGNKITITVPAFQNKVAIWFVAPVGGGTFTVSIEGVQVATVDTSAFITQFNRVVVDIPPKSTPAVTTYVIEHVAGSFVEIHGVSYYKDLSYAALENFSNSGRRLGELTDSVIDYACANASSLIVALGLNDTDALIADMRTRVDKLISACATSNTKLYIFDFMWTRAKSSLTRLELQRLHDSVPNSVYIPYPDFIKADGSIADVNYLTTTTGLWADIAHPNKRAHIWIAETAAKVMGLSVNSFASAVKESDYKYPTSLFNIIRNFDLTSSDTISTMQLSGSTLRLYFNIKDGFSATFPLGRQQIVSSWGKLSNVITGTRQAILPAVINAASGAVESTIEINPDGTMFLTVIASSTQNQRFFVDYDIKYLNQL